MSKSMFLCPTVLSSDAGRASARSRFGAWLAARRVEALVWLIALVAFAWALPSCGSTGSGGSGVGGQGPAQSTGVAMDGGEGGGGAWSPVGGVQYSAGVPESMSRQSRRLPAGVAAQTDVDFDGLLAPAASAMRPGDDLWIIERNAWGDDARAARRPPRPDNVPGSGALMCVPDGHTGEPLPMILERSDYAARVQGVVSSVELRQRFSNPTRQRVEAVYVFPLPDDAAVNGFVMTIGTRTIRAVIREREEAQRLYQEARERGHRASLLTQERSNIFTQKVANIEPGEAIDVAVTYFHTAGYRSGTAESPGSFEVVLPLTIGPRFNPPASTWRDPTGVDSAWEGDSTRRNAMPHTSARGGSTAVTYTRPSHRSGREVSVRVELDAGAGDLVLSGVESPSHAVRVTAGAGDGTRVGVELVETDRIANRDFVLRYRLAPRAGGALASSIVLHPDGGDPAQREGCFSMIIVPPADLASRARAPVEVILVVDTSGSMSGQPMHLAQQAARRLIGGLGPTDRLQIIRFSDKPDAFFAEPVEATPENIARGLRAIDDLRASGGTVMEPGVRLALNQPRRANTAERPIRYVWFLTDGFIGNEPDVLRVVRENLNDARVFGVGVGSSPNRTLLNAMARLGRGGAAYIASVADAEHASGVFLAQARAPALTDVRVDFGSGIRASDVFPFTLPELRADRPIMVVGRYRTEAGASSALSVRVSGLLEGRRVSSDVSVVTAVAEPDRAGWVTAPSAVAAVWARTMLQSLDDASRSAGAGARTSGWNSRAESIRSLALRHNLLSAYTAFVAVDSADRTAGWDPASVVNVPTEFPTGVDPSMTMPPEHRSAPGQERPRGSWR
ncbi:MAG: VWA domain-containing protein [Phycisphaeraceae bacterium]|nr:VWA domain-containing protein [Phycisphaeraceae bacterium]